MKSLTCNQCGVSRSALGLVEVMVSTLLVGVMIVASLESVGAVFTTHRLNADRLTGPNLAMELMTEVLSMPYEDLDTSGTTIGTEAGETASTRADFDDVDDYDGWDNTGVEAKDGSLKSDFSAWRRQVGVAWVNVATGADDTADTGLKRITVTVTSPEGIVSQLAAYRAKDGMVEQSPAVDITAVTWMGAELQLGTGSAKVSLGTNLMNHASDAN